jgi:hypothetical protein
VPRVSNIGEGYRKVSRELIVDSATQ